MPNTSWIFDTVRDILNELIIDESSEDEPYAVFGIPGVWLPASQRILPLPGWTKLQQIIDEKTLQKGETVLVDDNRLLMVYPTEVTVPVIIRSDFAGYWGTGMISTIPGKAVHTFNKITAQQTIHGSSEYTLATFPDFLKHFAYGPKSLYKKVIVIKDLRVQHQGKDAILENVVIEENLKNYLKSKQLGRVLYSIKNEDGEYEYFAGIYSLKKPIKFLPVNKQRYNHLKASILA